MNDDINKKNEEINIIIERNRKLIKRIKKVLINGAGASDSAIHGTSDSASAGAFEEEGASEEAVKKEIFIIPTKETFKLNNKYTITQLKQICKYYNQKISGTKRELNERIDYYFKKQCVVGKIQRFWRKCIYKKFMRLHGPARMNRALCVNETDFYTMESIKDIPYSKFFSFKDKDGVIYGFDIVSLYTLLFNLEDKKQLNPYNRNPFPNYMRRDLLNLIRLSVSLNLKINTVMETEEVEVIDPEKELELFSLSLFQHIDQLGNYTDPNWFWSLDNIKIVRFLKELNDIWIYRSQLTNETMREICFPSGNPFRNINLYSLSIYMPSIVLKKTALQIIEQFIKMGTTTSNQCLGANYVLCALTLVSHQAAAALPWLHQSVSYY
jgi:hypothetical protein